MVRRRALNAGALRSRWLARAAVTLPLLGFLGAFAALPALGQSPSQPHPRAVAESLTQALVDLHVQHQLADPALQAQLEGDLVAAAAARERHLAALVETNPREVLRVAIPAGMRALLPPAVQAHVEEDRFREFDRWLSVC